MFFFDRRVGRRSSQPAHGPVSYSKHLPARFICARYTDPDRDRNSKFVRPQEEVFIRKPVCVPLISLPQAVKKDRQSYRHGIKSNRIQRRTQPQGGAHPTRGCALFPAVQQFYLGKMRRSLPYQRSLFPKKSV